jgi:transcriptional regulator with XRE-family HTH domain
MGTTPRKTRRWPRGPAEAFGPRLRRLREARGFSQGQLGQAIGASQRMIAYYETHAEKAPARHLTALAQVLRVSVDELVGYQPVETPAGRANLRLWHRLRQVEALPPSDRKQVLQLIDTLVERETLKKRSTKGG